MGSRIPTPKAKTVAGVGECPEHGDLYDNWVLEEGLDGDFWTRTWKINDEGPLESL